jgi:aryl-alcohol dehydrogenase-like predicted oxidoreductase
VRYGPLGDSGLIVSELALGTMVFGEESERGATAGESTRMIRRFLDAGGTHIDTADVYAGGRSEEIVGEALEGRRDEVVIATKVRFATGEGPNDVGLGRRHIMDGVEASLRRLRTDAIDLLYMHAWDPVTPIDESLQAFDDLVRAGKVRYVGVSNFKAWQLAKALGLSEASGWARFVAAQYQYSLVVRDIEFEYADLCLEEGLGLVPWSPLGGGFLSGKYRPDKRPSAPSDGRLATQPDDDEEAWHRRSTDRNWRILEAVRSVADIGGWTVPQVALAWISTRPFVASTIIGVRTMDQLEDDLASVEVDLDEEALAMLDEISAVPPGYPYRFLDLYGTRTVERW